MERRLRNRSIKVIVYDEEIPLRYYTFDFIHLTGEGHAMIAATLLPRIMAAINRRPYGVGTKPLLERPSELRRSVTSSHHSTSTTGPQHIVAQVHFVRHPAAEFAEPRRIIAQTEQHIEVRASP
jgi:hypothetical protein